MGGGDLNLKKSWHPHTMKNQEKVWKAEQAKTQEEKKLNDLRKEIEEEKSREELRRVGRESGVLGGITEVDKKLDWMYKSSSELINREEYLLGRKIDKSFEILQAEEKQNEQQSLGVKQPLNHVEHECVPFSIRAYKNLENSEQVDLQRKVMEDPLMLIKQREMETRRKILENPVKLKELHRILKTDENLQKVSKKSKKLKKSKKSRKKRKKSEKTSSSSSNGSGCDSDSDLDNKLERKLKGGLLNKDEASNFGLNLTKLLDTKFEKISQELDKAAGKSKRRSKKNKSKSNNMETSYSSDKKKNYRRSRSSSESRKFISKDLRSNSGSKDRERISKNYQQRRFGSSPIRTSDKRQGRNCTSTSKSRDTNINRKSRSASRTREQNIKIDKSSYMKKSSLALNKIRSRSNSEEYKKSYRFESKLPKSLSRTECSRRQKSEKPNSNNQHSNKLTDEEKQVKLKEMMSNAAWREEERTEVVRKHRELNAREEESYMAREFDRDFLNKEVKKAMASQTSVVSRLRANLNNIQRTSVAMNSNFARK